MRKPILLLFVFFFAFPIFAHEFWLQPEKFRYAPGEDINIRFWVGEDFDGTNWSGNKSKVKSLQLIQDNIKDNLADQLSDEQGDSLQVSIFDEGTAIIAFNSTNSFIQLDTTKFNAYLREDGLQSTIDYRLAHHETDSSGREFYQRSVKTLIQVGDKKTNVSQPTNLPLDIIPLSNPYTLSAGDTLTVKMLFNKKILFNQLVNVWQRVEGKTSKMVYQTNEKGEVSFAIGLAGKWMVSTVKMLRLEHEPAANWQSYWGSCTWGYE